jgi:hypothetical protein
LLWPDKHPQPDVMLSIGTGWASDRLSITRPKSPGAFSRLADALDWNLCAERQWKEIINFTPVQFRDRYHRINLQLDTKEPRIDDISMIDSLQLKTEAMLNCTDKLSHFHTRWLASLFFVEIENVVNDISSIKCSASIFCRQRIPKSRMPALYDKLSSWGAYFLVNGKVLCITKPTQFSSSTFRCLVDFTVEDMSNDLHISLGLRELELRWPISGLPRRLDKLIEVQGYGNAFGRSDHHSAGGAVAVPLKRSLRLGTMF